MISAAPLRCLLAGEQALVRAGLRCLMAQAVAPRVQVLAETDDGVQLLSLAAQHRPDVVVLDHGLNSMGGPEVTERLRGSLPQTRVLFASGRADPPLVRAALMAGAHGYLLLSEPREALVEAIGQLAAGQEYFSPAIAELARNRRLRVRGEREGTLTARQRQVLRLLARGKSTREIAAQMQVSIKTVETHRARMASVLGLHGVNALMRFAIKSGMDSGEL